MKTVFLLAVLPLVLANQCSRNQYWSSDLRACLSCSRCEKNQILIRPCSTHRDSECSTISHEGLDISWLDKEKENDIFELADDDDTVKSPKTEKNNEDQLLLRLPGLSEVGDGDETVKSPKPEKKNEDRLLLRLPGGSEVEDDEIAKSTKLEKKSRNQLLLKLSSASEGDDDIYQDFLHSKHDPPKKKDKAHKKQKKHHYKFNQRMNDKFLKWDDLPTTKRPHRNRLVFDPFKNLEKTHHHFTFPGSLDDFPVENLKYEKFEKKGKALHDKSASKRKMKKFYGEDDEEKLEELLIMSEKELAQRKEDLLKNIKKDEYETEESNQKVKLSYPLYNRESELLESVAQNSLQDSSKEKHKSIINDDIFKELVKDNAESKLEIETLMSNKKDSQYRAETANRHMFMGEPSTISEIIGQVKDPQEVINEKVGSNFIIEKSKLSVVPVMEDSSVVAAVPFTAVERFVWDWQAVALISAVTACLLFFMVVTVYSLLINSQLKRSKASCYTADMEEMSTRIALMQPTLEPNSSEGLTLKKYPTDPAPTHKI